MKDKLYWVANAKFSASLEQEVTGRTSKILLQAAAQYHPMVSGQEEDDLGYYYILSLHFFEEPDIAQVTKIFTSIATLRLLPLREDSIQLQQSRCQPVFLDDLPQSTVARLPLSEIPVSLLQIVNSVINEVCSQGHVRSTGWYDEGSCLLENLEFYFDKYDDDLIILNIKSLTSKSYAGIPDSLITEESLWSTLQHMLYPER